MLHTVALNEKRPIGSTIDYLGRPYRIIGKLTRREYWDDVQRRRRLQVEAGLPLARAGVYTDETREFKPTLELPPECKYCYRIEPIAPF
jgi:hypothetical protein